MRIKDSKIYLSLGFSCPQHCCFFWIILKITSGNAHIGLSTLCYSYSSQILSEVKAELEMFPPIPSSSFSPVLRGTDLNVVCGQISLLYRPSLSWKSWPAFFNAFIPFNPNILMEEWVADSVHWQSFERSKGEKNSCDIVWNIKTQSTSYICVLA